MNVENVIKELQDNLIVIAEIERRQSELVRERSELIAESAVFQRRTEQNLAKITDKLNGLIGTWTACAHLTSASQPAQRVDNHHQRLQPMVFSREQSFFKENLPQVRHLFEVADILVAAFHQTPKPLS